MSCTSIFDPIRDNCNKWLSKQGRQCMLPASRWDDRLRAEELRKRVVTKNPRSRDVAILLHEIAELVHCNRHHRKDPIQIQATAAFWLEELREAARAIPLTPPATPPATPPPHTTYRVQGTMGNIQVDVNITTTNLGINNLPSPPVTPPRVPPSSSQTQFRSPPPPEPPQTRRPVTRSQTQSYPQHARSPRTPPTFTPKRLSSTESIPQQIANLVRKRFRTKDHKHGYIYMFTRAGDPDFVKIGHSGNVERRMTEWERSCGYTPVLIYKSPRIRNVYRIEQLIFTQLAEYRRIDHRCHNNSDSDCDKKHNEWFRLRVSDAQTVIDRWIEWINDDDLSYDEDGDLTEDIQEYMEEWLTWVTTDPETEDEELPSALSLHFGAPIPSTEDSTDDDTDDTDDSYDSDDSDDSDDTSSTVDTEADTPEEEAEEESSPPECAICYETLNPDEQSQYRPCTTCHNSSWHDHCIGLWLTEGRGSCPMCRGRDTIR